MSQLTLERTAPSTVEASTPAPAAPAREAAAPGAPTSRPRGPAPEVLAGRLLRAGWVGLVVALLLWPTHSPADDPVPAWEAALGLGFFLGWAVLVGGLARRRAWARPLSAGMAGLGVLLTLACGANHPTSDWYLGMVAFPLLLGLSLAPPTARFLRR